MSPNRIAVYITAALALLAGVAPIVGNLDFASTAGVIASITVLGGVVIKWLSGWQQYEAANYQHDLIQLQAAARAESEAAAVAAAQQAGGIRKPSINLPR